MSYESLISKWGNSQGVRIPKEIVQSLGLVSGDKVKIFLKDGKVILEPIKQKKYTIDELIKKIPKDYKQDKEMLTTPMGKEIW